MSHSSNFSLPGDTPDFILTRDFDAPRAILTRDFDAPRALLWTCWMEPSHLSRWWGPEGFICPVCEVDPQAGGRFRLVIRSPEGADYAMSGIFREIVPHEKIVKEDDVSEHSEEWHDMIDSARKGQGKRKIEMLTTVTFEDHGKAARLTMRTRFPSIVLRDNFAGMGAKQAWISSLERLEDLSNALKDSDREFNIVRVVSAPVAKVFAAFSDPQGMAKWWGPNGFTTTTHHMNFRAGGTWTYTMHGPDGTDYPNHVAYTAIETNHSIAYDHGSAADRPAMFKAVISFEPQGAKTRVALRLILGDAAQRPHYVSFGAVEGGYQNLERLDAFLAVQH